MRKRLWVNDKEFTDITGPAKYNVTYEIVEGPNSGFMQSGLEVKDAKGTRPVNTVPMMPATEERAAEFIAEVCSRKYAKVKFFDLKTRDYITKSCIYDEIKSEHLLTSVDGHDYWYCGAFVFRTQECETWDS